MAGYPDTQEQSPLMEENGWVLADAGTVPAGFTLQENSAPEVNEQALSVDVQTLSVEVALAFPSLPKVPSKLDAVLSVIAPTAQHMARAPLRLVAVLDKSGSMTGEKIKLVIETTKFMLQHLTERDALGLVAFDTSVQLLAPLTRCNSEGRAHLESVINRVKAGSQTNLSGGLLRGLELHSEALRDTVEDSVAMQRVHFGNRYRKLSEPVEAPERKPPPAGAERVHEWTMELRTESSADAELIEKVVYKLHETFQKPVIELTEPPFCLTKVGWGCFKVFADVHLRDGRVLPLEHELCFDKTEHFLTKLLPLQSAPQAAPPHLEPEDDQAVVRSTFLFTDGAANVGMKTSDEVCRAVEAVVSELGSKKCTISTFGFGADHSEDLLRNIANTGKGVYCFIENADAIGEAFGEALGGLLSVTHQNVRLCLDLAPGVTLVKARTKYPVEGPTCGENAWQSMNIDVGDLFAEERRDILLELSLPEAASDGPETIAQFHSRAFSVLGTRSEKTSISDIVIERSGDVDADRGQAHPQVERHRNRYVASEALESARLAGRQGNLEEARATLQAASNELLNSSIAAQGCPLTAALLADVQECVADLRNQDTYTSMGSKKMAYMQMAHERQRTCGRSTTDTYCNSAGLFMKSQGASIKSMPARFG